jgi:hypothetical protein
MKTRITGYRQRKGWKKMWIVNIDIDDTQPDKREYFYNIPW